MGLPVRGLHGAHLRADLVARFGRHRIANAVAHRELCPLWRGVLVEPDRLLDPWTRAAAATLSAGPMSAITGATAAVLHGCPAADSSNTHGAPCARQSCSTWHRNGWIRPRRAGSG